MIKMLNFRATLKKNLITFSSHKFFIIKSNCLNCQGDKSVQTVIAHTGCTVALPKLSSQTQRSFTMFLSSRNTLSICIFIYSINIFASVWCIYGQQREEKDARRVKILNVQAISSWELCLALYVYQFTYLNPPFRFMLNSIAI